jgi:hypothetical protein
LKKRACHSHLSSRWVGPRATEMESSNA